MVGPKEEDPTEGTHGTAADTRQRRKGWPSVTNIQKAWGRQFRYIELVGACPLLLSVDTLHGR